MSARALGPELIDGGRGDPCWGAKRTRRASDHHEAFRGIRPWARWFSDVRARDNFSAGSHRAATKLPQWFSHQAQVERARAT